MLDARIPSGEIEQKWDNCRFEMKLVNPANRRKHSVIVVGAGLAGAAAAATLGQQGYQVHCFSYHDTPRRAHSIAAQGGINAAKNYRNDGDSVLRLFKDTVKGGDFRAREANVYRLRKSASTSSISAWRKACRLRGSTAGRWPIDPSEAPRYPGHFMPEARLGSNCCWARTKRWSGRYMRGASQCTLARKCWTWL